MDAQTERWDVYIEWSGRKALAPVSVRALRARQARLRRFSFDGLGDLSGCLGSDLDVVIFMLMAVAIIVVLAPLLSILLFAVLEVTIVFLVALVAIATRTLLGRPWSVVAISTSGQLWSWKQVGWSRSRELVTRLQRELDAGAEPSRIAPGDAQPQGQQQLPDNIGMPLTSKPWVRVTSKVVAVILVIAAVVTVVN